MKRAQEFLRKALKKKWLVVLLIVGIFFVAAPLITQRAHAISLQTPDFFSCIVTGGNVATCGIYQAALFVQDALLVFIPLAATFIQFSLNLNGHIYDSPAVNIGYSIALALANGFLIIRIIKIAIETILRMNGHGTKKGLFYVVAIAILMNFAFVLTRPIISISDGMTYYFLRAASGSASDEPGIGMINNLAEALKPQQLLQKDTTPFSSKTDNDPANVYSTSLMGVVFIIVFLSIIAIAFGGLALILFVRYLFISGLLIFLPLALIFDKIQQWLKEFMKWAPFPVLVTFVIYLSLQASVFTTWGQGYLSQTNPVVSSADKNIPSNAVVIQTNKLAGLQNALDQVLLVGILAMGLLAAAKAAGSFGTGFVNGVKSVGNFVTGQTKKTALGKNYLGKQLYKRGKTAFNAAGGHTLMAGLRGGALGGIGVALERQLHARTTNEHLIDERKKAYAGRDADELKEILANSRASMEDKLAIISVLRDKGKLNTDSKTADVTKVGTRDGLVDINTFFSENRHAIDNFGGDKLRKEYQTQTALKTDKMSDAEMEIAHLRETGGSSEAIKAAADKLKEAADELFTKLKRSDHSKVDANGIFGKILSDQDKDGHTSRGAVYHQLASEGYIHVAGLMAQMNKNTLRQFDKNYQEFIKKDGIREKIIERMPDGTPQEKEEKEYARKELGKIRSSYERAVAKASILTDSGKSETATPKAEKEHEHKEGKDHAAPHKSAGPSFFDNLGGGDSHGGSDTSHGGDGGGTHDH